jgi:hypothetical protein
LAVFVVGPLQPALLAEQKIIYFTNQFEHPLRVLLDGLFTQFFPTFSLFLHAVLMTQSYSSCAALSHCDVSFVIQRFHFFCESIHFSFFSRSELGIKLNCIRSLACHPR